MYVAGTPHHYWKRTLVFSTFIHHDWVCDFFAIGFLISVCCWLWKTVCICNIFILCCGEFSLLDPNRRCSRLFWNGTWLLNCGRMPVSMHKDGYMRCYWLGAKQRWADVLDSDNDIHEKYYNERSYSSLRNRSRLSELVLLLILIHMPLFRYS